MSQKVGLLIGEFGRQYYVTTLVDTCSDYGLKGDPQGNVWKYVLNKLPKVVLTYLMFVVFYFYVLLLTMGRS